jgi:hypothetical protein
MEEAVVGLMVAVPLLGLAGGILILLMSMYQRTKTLEMRHRERMAMIERGLMPSPESDPARFDATSRPPAAGPPRFTSLGIALVGLGLGLMLIIGFAGEAPGPAIGVGGAIAILGAAFVVNGYLQRNHVPASAHRGSVSTTPRPPRLEPTDPPGPVGP